LIKTNPEEDKMKKTLIAALAILLAFGSLAAQPQIRTLSIMETAEISISPDLCIMTILIETTNKDRNVAYNENKDIVSRIITVLKDDNKIEAKDIQTTHFTAKPIYRRTVLNKHVFEGYNISTGLKVKIRNFTKILPIMDAVIQAGATKISKVTFTLDEPKKYEAEVREKAMKAAEAKALQIAKLSGVTLGKPLSISEFPFPQSFEAQQYRRVVDLAAGGLHIQGGRTSEKVYVSSSGVPVALEPGEINLSYTLYVTYELL